MKEDRINGIPRDGVVAYREGVLAADCPYIEGDPDFDRWNTEWDLAADIHEFEVMEAKQPKGPGSVITGRYRARYAEDGHPTHCGDQLATLLNDICSNKSGTNLELFEVICGLNGVSLAKYNRTNKGWQGRLRMTGRNLLARKVRDNGGILAVPESMGGKIILSKEWVEEATVKYKPKMEQT